MAVKRTAAEKKALEDTKNLCLEALSCGYLGYLAGGPCSEEEKKEAKDVYVRSITQILEITINFSEGTKKYLYADILTLGGMLVIQNGPAVYPPPVVRIFAGTIAASLARIVALITLTE